MWGVENIFDHLFVVNAAVNNVINGSGKSFDMQGLMSLNVLTKCGTRRR